MRRAVTVPEQDRNCSTNRLAYKTMADFDRIAKPQLQPFIDAISSYSGDQVIQMKDSRDVNQNATYNTLFSQLQVAENQLNSYIQCIQKDILQRNDFSSRLYNLQQEVEVARKASQQRKETAAEAKERVSDVTNPYTKTTWWESWFPLGRPIEKDNVPVLLSVSIFMLVFSLGIFLRMAGMELKLTSVESVTNSLTKNLNPRKYP